MNRLDKKDYFKKIMKRVLELYMIQLLESKDLSKSYGSRYDQEEIDKKVAEIAEKVAEIIIDDLEKRQMLDEIEADQGLVKNIFEKSAKEALERFNGLNNSE